MNQKQVTVVVKSFKDNVEKRWTLDPIRASETDDTVVYHVFLEECDPEIITRSLYAPRTPLPDPSPVAPLASSSVFKTVVHDSQAWINRSLFASDEETEQEEEREEEEKEEESVEPPRKRGRPRGSKNKSRGDKAWIKPRKQPKNKSRHCSAVVMRENIENQLECSCCAEDSQLLLRCNNEKCDQYLCISCLERVERRFEGVCPYCRLQF